MKEQDKKEIRQIFNEGIEQLILPHFDEIIDKLDEHTKILDEHTKILGEHTKILDKHTKILDGHGQDLWQIEHKLDAEVNWRDSASKRLKRVEIKLGMVK